MHGPRHRRSKKRWRLYSDKNYAEARVALLKACAKAGTTCGPWCCSATLYQKGQGVEEFCGAKARDWFGKAAEAGDAEAQLAYACCLLDEAAGDVDPAAKHADQLASEGGGQRQQPRPSSISALIYAGQYGAEPDWPKAVEWFGKAAASGVLMRNTISAFSISMAKGWRRMPLRRRNGLSKAALKGMPEAALEYGVLVIRGEGVERNIDIGIKWLRMPLNTAIPWRKTGWRACMQRAPAHRRSC
jgi:TPR repeat protein